MAGIFRLARAGVLKKNICRSSEYLGQAKFAHDRRQTKDRFAPFICTFFFAIFLAGFMILGFSCSRGAGDFGGGVMSQREMALAARFMEDSSLGETRWAGTGFNPEALPVFEAQEVSALRAQAAPAGITADSNLAAMPHQPSREQAARKRIFTAGCTIRTASFTAGILEVAAIAEKYNGWVYSSSDRHITIRVPAENFRKAFDEIIRGRDVVDKFEEANDVTEYYSDLAARLEVFRNTRQRLERLLAAETDTERKVPILREIRRIDDQIERLRTNLEHLERAIAFSTITVNFISHRPIVPHTAGTVFKWVDSLNPFYVTIPNVFRRLTVPLPEDFVILRRVGLRYFHAEAADGTIVRIGTVRNNPKGDSSFWRRVIIHTIGARFSEYTKAEAGEIKYVVFEPKGGMDYRYLVGTAMKRKLIYVIEVYFPSSNIYEKRIDSINSALEGLRIR